MMAYFATDEGCPGTDEFKAIDAKWSQVRERVLASGEDMAAAFGC